MFDRLIEILQGCFHALVPWVVLAPYERGVLVRLGKFVREVEPGFTWCWPFYIDIVYHHVVVPRTDRLAGLAATTSDGKSIGFDAVITYRIVNIQKAALEVYDLKDAISDSCAGVIGTALSAKTWEDIRTGAGDIGEVLETACHKRARKWGVEIQSVQLTGVAVAKNLRLQVCSPHAIDHELHVSA